MSKPSSTSSFARTKAILVGLMLLAAWRHPGHAAGQVVVWGYYAGSVSNVPPGLTNVVAVAAGLDHALALREDGTVVAWGSDFWETNTPAGLSNVVAISAGWLFSMALRNDGTVATWGLINPTPPNLTNVVAIAAGGHQFCLALRVDGTVTAWGWNGSGQTNVPSDLTNVVAIAAGLDHSAALRKDGTVVVWGSMDFEEHEIPPGLTNVVAISAGWAQTLALRADGTVAGWGSDAHVPDGLSNVVAVAGGWDAGQEFLQRDGLVVYGDPTLSNAVAVARGHFFAMAITVPVAPSLLLARPLSALNWQAGRFRAATQTRQGKVYALEFKDDLSPGGWKSRPLVNGNGGVMRIEDDSAAPPRRFYRLLEW